MLRATAFLLAIASANRWSLAGRSWRHQDSWPLPLNSSVNRNASSSGTSALLNLSASRAEVSQRRAAAAAANASDNTSVVVAPEVFATAAAANASVAALAGFAHEPAFELHRFYVLLSILALGKLLQLRFSTRDLSAVKKLLLQILVPAGLFQGLSCERPGGAHLLCLGAGIFLVLVRLLGGLLATGATLGDNIRLEQAKRQRTAIFQMSTMASGLSVFPFLGEFLGARFVGFGGMVDVAMKFYMLALLPWLLRNFASGGHASGEASGWRTREVLASLLKDPMTQATVAGLLAGAATDGGGSAALGLIGRTIDVLARAQSPVLFLLIGFSLKIDVSTPILSFVLVLATQGFMLIMAQFVLIWSEVSDSTGLFIILFAQGAPSVVGTGIINAALSAGVQGYSTDLAFDLVRLSFPVSALLQCTAAAIGPAYRQASGVAGAALVTLAVLLRVAFAGHFRTKQFKPTNDSLVHARVL